MFEFRINAARNAVLCVLKGQFDADEARRYVAKFKAAWESEAVSQGMDAAGQALRQYRVSGVPALLVNGRYYVSVKLAGSEEAMFDVVNFLMHK